MDALTGKFFSGLFDGIAKSAAAPAQVVSEPAKTIAQRLIAAMAKRPIMTAATGAAAGAGVATGVAEAKARKEEQEQRREQIRQLLLARLSESGYSYNS